MAWLVDNWMVLICVICCVATFGMMAMQFYKKPTDDQIKAIKEWLLYAVTMAEKDLGSGTGKLKLRQVYDAFVQRFSWAARFISFGQFRLWVEEALSEMQHLLASDNSAVKTFLEGK